MGNTLRCCLACVLPCGALDVVRIVHSDGRVQELFRPVRAADVIKTHPKHVLKKPSSRSSDGPRIVVVPPDALLQRGKIYFLIPAFSSSSKKVSSRRKSENPIHNNSNSNNSSKSVVASSTKRLCNSVADSDRYLKELLSEKVSTERDRDRDRRRRVAVWRPHLESITEATSAGENSGDP